MTNPPSECPARAPCPAQALAAAGRPRTARPAALRPLTARLTARPDPSQARHDRHGQSPRPTSGADRPVHPTPNPETASVSGGASCCQCSGGPLRPGCQIRCGASALQHPLSTSTTGPVLCAHDSFDRTPPGRLKVSRHPHRQRFAWGTISKQRVSNM